MAGTSAAECVWNMTRWQEAQPLDGLGSLSSLPPLRQAYLHSRKQARDATFYPRSMTHKLSGMRVALPRPEAGRR